jgi:Pentapeptide repeats (8 copies)
MSRYQHAAARAALGALGLGRGKRTSLVPQRGASLRGARLGKAELAGTDLEGANLHFAENLDAALVTGAKLCNTKMPDGLTDNINC